MTFPSFIEWVDCVSADGKVDEIIRRIENFRSWYEIGGKQEKCADQRKSYRESAEMARMMLDALAVMTDAEHIALKLADYKLGAFDPEYWKQIALRAGWTQERLSDL